MNGLFAISPFRHCMGFSSPYMCRSWGSLSKTKRQNICQWSLCTEMSVDWVLVKRRYCKIIIAIFGVESVIDPPPLTSPLPARL